MTKQEEIREGIYDILIRYGNFMDGYDADSDELDIDEALGAILSYLHSHGVVILTGYATEPLIEEKL